MNDILRINIDFEKNVLELKTEELEDEIPFSKIETKDENGKKLMEFVGDGQSFVLVVTADGLVVDYFWRE